VRGEGPTSHYNVKLQEIQFFSLTPSKSKPVPELCLQGAVVLDWEVSFQLLGTGETMPCTTPIRFFGKVQIMGDAWDIEANVCA
jgi:hypothetical protein